MIGHVRRVVVNSANGIRSVRTRDGTTVDLRADGTPMGPAGRRIEFNDSSPPDEHSNDPGPLAGLASRTIRVIHCELHTADVTARLAAAIRHDQLE